MKPPRHEAGGILDTGKKTLARPPLPQGSPSWKTEFPLALRADVEMGLFNEFFFSRRLWSKIQKKCQNGLFGRFWGSKNPQAGPASRPLTREGGPLGFPLAKYVPAAIEPPPLPVHRLFRKRHHKKWGFHHPSFAVGGSAGRTSASPPAAHRSRSATRPQPRTAASHSQAVCGGF